MYSLMVGLALAVAAPAAKEAPKKEPPSLVGEWAAESALKGGKPDNPPPGTSIAFKADGKVLMKEGKADRAEQGTYTADPKKNPPEFDLMPPSSDKGPNILGIYKIEGDTLTLCITMGGERPKTFESPVGSQVMLITCKRVKKD